MPAPFGFDYGDGVSTHFLNGSGSFISASSVTLTGPITISGCSLNTGNFTTNGSLIVSGSSTFSGKISVDTLVAPSNTLAITGAITTTLGANIGGDTGISGSLITGNVSSGSMRVSGSLAVANALSVGDRANFSSALSTSGSMGVGGDLVVTGDVYTSKSTWTPAFTGLTLTAPSTTSISGRYTKVGKICFYTATLTPTGGTTTSGSAGGGTYINNLPFTSNANDFGNLEAHLDNFANLGNGHVGGNSTVGYTPAWAATTRSIFISGWYETA